MEKTGGDERRSTRKRIKWSAVERFLVVTCRRFEGVLEGDSDEKRETKEEENMASTAAGVQNLLLSLKSENIATKWATGPIMTGSEVRDRLGLVSGEAVVAGIMCGGGREEDEEGWMDRLPRRRRTEDMFREMP